MDSPSLATRSSTATSLVTLILAVRNAEHDVGPALERILELRHDGPADLIVVSNGSSDRTVHEARTYEARFTERGWGFTVLELDEPGKPAALRAAEAKAGAGAVVILDVRVRPDRDALVEVLSALDSGDIDLASGTLRYDGGSSRLVQRFARAYQQTPYVRSSDVQGTFLAISAAHRGSVAAMPDVGADDRYYLAATPRARRTRVPRAYVDYPFPDTFAGLLRQQVRWHRTNRAVDRILPHADVPDHNTDRWPYFSRPRPRLLDIAVYGAVAGTTRLWARFTPGPTPGW